MATACIACAIKNALTFAAADTIAIATILTLWRVRRPLEDSMRALCPQHIGELLAGAIHAERATH